LRDFFRLHHSAPVQSFWAKENLILVVRGAGGIGEESRRYENLGLVLAPVKVRSWGGLDSSSYTRLPRPLPKGPGDEDAIHYFANFLF